MTAADIAMVMVLALIELAPFAIMVCIVGAG